MESLTKKTVFVCVLAVMLMSVLSTTLMCYSLIPCSGSRSGESGLWRHEGNFIPQEWGFQRTITNAASSKPASPYAGFIAQIDPTLSKPASHGACVTIGIAPMASGRIYLNNLNLRF